MNDLLLLFIFKTFTKKLYFNNKSKTKMKQNPKKP